MIWIISLPRPWPDSACPRSGVKAPAAAATTCGHEPSAVAVLAGGQPSVTILINGGQIAYSDAEHSIEQGRPLVVLGGTGRTADAIAAAADPRAAEIAASDLTTVVPVAEPAEMDKAVDAVLGGAVHA